MADSLSLLGLTQICVARGIVPWESKDDDAAGELQLLYRGSDNYYCLFARKTAGHGKAVCKVYSALTKSKRYQQRSRNFISSNTENK